MARSRSEGFYTKLGAIAAVVGIVVGYLTAAAQNHWWPFSPDSTAEGTATLIDAQGIDLDSGKVATDERSSSIDVSPGPRGDHLYGIGPGVALALLPTDSADESKCTQAISSSTASDKRAVALYSLRPEQVVCVRTNQHRIAALTLRKIPSSAPGDDAVAFDYITYPD